jgi:hypothetical protein
MGGNSRLNFRSKAHCAAPPRTLRQITPMVRRTDDSAAVHVATRSEIERLAHEYNSQRDAVVAELQDTYRTRAPGTAPPDLTSDEMAVRKMASSMLNGMSPPNLLPVTASYEHELFLRKDAIDLVLGVLGMEEFRARATEAAQLAVATDSEWRALCHDLLTTALRLEALEKKAVEFRRQFAGHEPSNMPMVRYLGNQHKPSALGISWANAPLSRPLVEALEAGIVSSREVKDIQNNA